MTILNPPAGERFDAQPARRVLFRMAVGRHAALPADAPAERNAGQVAAKIVGPVVIDAGDFLGVAAFLVTQQRAAMG